jgi:hypothetical protein
MIIWRGCGILVLVITALVVVSIQLIAEAVGGEGAYQPWMAGLGVLLSAVPVWFLGRYFNNRGARTLVDKATGQEVVLRPNHSLFFIKMEYWAAILAVSGIGLVIFGLFSS